MYDTILVPTDGSGHAGAAIERAVDLAERYGSTLHALFVVDTGYPYADFETAAIDWESVAEAMERQGEAATATVRERAEARDVPVETEVRRDTSVHRAILDYADEHGVDLIVMGTHGRRGLDRYLLGSVTEKVVRLADVPVLTVKAPEAE